jgi:hypothetical protein
MIYKIPATNYPQLTEKIDRLNKRADKLGVKHIELKIVDTETVVRKSKMGFEYDDTFYHCEVIGESPQMAGWELIACVEPVEDGSENMVREVPGVVCPAKFRTTNTHCDHCKTNRRRNAVFVLKHDDGTYCQVGRNCIADFLGHTDPEKILNDAQYIFNFIGAISEAQDEQYIDPSKRLPTTAEFVSVVSVVSRKLGWTPKSQVDEYNPDSKRATADIAWDLCVNDDNYVRDFVKKHSLIVEDRDIQRAQVALKWASAIDPENAYNTYLHDLGVACRQDCVTWKRRGYVASVVSSYQKHQEREEKKQRRKVSRFVGTLKERRVFEDLKIVMIHEYETDFGVRAIVKFFDPDDNILVWRASSDQDGNIPDWLEQGQVFTVKATVVKHDYYGDVQETIINRVSPINDE